MAAMKTHPSVAALEAFTLGTLDDSALEDVESHLAECPSCQERAANSADDNLVQVLRRIQAQTIPHADTVAHAPTPGPGRSHAADTEIFGAVPRELAQHPRYGVVRLLGEGGMGSVYEAEHRVMQRPVALKVIKGAFTSRPAAVERFRREVRAAARLTHPNIVTTYDAEDAGNTLFLVMEYVEGVSLARLVKERGPLPVPVACDYVRQAALGLQHAHERGMIHRDVKPDNLILSASSVASAPGAVKVLDFGLATLTAECGENLTDADMVMGTPDFMAPEQAENPRTADIRADVYSLGCTLYYLLTGVVPYPGETSLQRILAHREQPLPAIRDARPDVPAALARVLERMFAKKPENRYQTPGAAAAALAPFTPQAASPARSRHRRLLAIAATVLFVGIGLLAGAIYRIQTDTGELIVTTESDDVEVIVTQGGKLIRIIDTKTDKQVTLHSGTYELEVKGGPAGLKLNIDRATLTRGEKVLAKVERVPANAVGEIRRFQGDRELYLSVAFSPDARLVLTCESNHTAQLVACDLQLWDAKTGKAIRRLTGHPASISGAVFTRDGKRIISSAFDDRTIRVWDVESGKEVQQIATAKDVYGLAVLPDGKRALSCDEGVLLWDLESGKELRRFDGHTGIVRSIAVSPDGKTFLSAGGQDQTVRLWDIDGGQELRRFDEHNCDNDAVAFSPDGVHFLSSSVDHEIRLWDLKTGKVVRRFVGHSTRAGSLLFTPDGKRFLSSGDMALWLWDVDTAKVLHRFEGHTAPVWGAAMSPDGRYALSGSMDHTARLWRLPAGQKDAQVKAKDPR